MRDFLEEIKTFRFHYFVLLIILALSGVAFFYFRYFRSVQIIISLLTGLVYVLWGLIHHYYEGDLHLKIVLEYLATVTFGLAVIWFLLLRA